MEILERRSRVYSGAEGLDREIASCERSWGVTCQRRVALPERDLVASAAAFRDGAGEIVHGPREATGSRNFTARHPDGLALDYLGARS